MGSESGMESSAVNLRALEESLREEPAVYGFFQAVHLLERLRPDRAAVGEFADPAEEAVRFSVNPSLAFPPSEIHSLDLPAEGVARMSVNFLGLTGPQGVLPHHYSLLVTERSRARDTALREFLDLFHHRLLSLFYQAWKKYRFTVSYENREPDRLTEHLLDLAGLGLEASRGFLPVADEALVFYLGLLAPQQRSAVALEQMLEDFFGVPVEVQQFVGAWYGVSDHDQCRLQEQDGPSGALGMGTVVGDEIWDPQSRVRLRLGPMRRAQYERFLPTGSAYELLRKLVRFFSHDQLEFELQLVLAGQDIPSCVLGDEGSLQPLGWSTWIRTSAFATDAEDTILTL